MEVFLVTVVKPWDYTTADISDEVFMLESKARERYEEIKKQHESNEDVYWYHKVFITKMKVQ